MTFEEQIVLLTKDEPSRFLTDSRITTVRTTEVPEVIPFFLNRCSLCDIRLRYLISTYILIEQSILV